MIVAAEDAGDIALYDERKAAAETPLPAAVSMDVLRGATRLKALRKWRGLTQAELAAGGGISQDFLSDLESNRRKPSAETAAMLAKALAAPVEWIEG